MKKIFLLLAASLFLIVSCSDDWDKHYDGNTTIEDISPLNLQEYFESAEDYTRFYNLLKNTGTIDELGRDQYLTVWAIKDVNYDISPVDDVLDTLLATYHVGNLAFGLADLKDGLRIMGLNGVYVTIREKEDGFYVNQNQILSTKRFQNGVVHEIPALMRPLGNLFEYLKDLGDDYSIIRDSILFYNEIVFDLENSIPKGIDLTGNPTYDSAWVETNPLFETIDLRSEAKEITMFLPDNNVIKECFETMHEQYKLMGKTFGQSDTLLAINWIKEAMFIDKIVENYHAQTDLNSPFDRVWRTSVQQVDEDNFEELSNGRVYKVNKLKIPNNVIINRIKSLLRYYDYLSDEDKESGKVYLAKGVKPGEDGVVRLDVNTFDKFDDNFQYYVVIVKGDINSDEELSLDFPPLDYNAETETVSVMRVPPGEYNLHMGFRSSAHPYVNIYFQSGSDFVSDDAEAVQQDIWIQSSNPWNYDRVNDTQDRDKWDGIGGLVGVVNVEGEGMETFRIKVEFSKLYPDATSKQMQIYHWALVPTSNNY